MGQGTPWIPDELPYVRGRGWWVFLPIWIGIFAAAVIGIIGPLQGSWTRYTTISPPALVGIQLRDDVEDRAVIAYPQTEEAARAGIAAGQRIVGVDGQRVDRSSDVLDPLRGPTGTIALVETISSDGRRAGHRLTRDPTHLREAYRKAHLPRGVVYAASLLAFYVGTGLLPLLCGLLLLIRRAGDRFAPWASLALVWNGLGNGPAVIWYSDEGANWPLYAVLNSICAAVLLLTLVLFPDGRFTSRRMKILSLSMVAVVAVTQGVSSRDVSNILVAVGMVISVFFIADRMRRHADQQAIQQIRWVLFGFAGAALALLLSTGASVAMTNAGTIDVRVWAELTLWLVAFAMMALLFGGITIGLLRFRLYGADAVISRSIAYGGITLFLLGIFAGSEKVVELLGEEYFGKSLGPLAGVLGAAMAAICIGPIHHRVTHWAEKRFRSGLILLRDGLPLLVGDMRETATPSSLADAMLTRVERGVRAQYGAVVIDRGLLLVRDIEEAVVEGWLNHHDLSADDQRRFRIDHDDTLFPVQVPLSADGFGYVGCLLLGPRPDGSLYGREERAALRDIADPVARALAIAIERERREHARADRERARDQEIGQLRDIVFRLRERIGWEPSMDAAPVR